VVSPSLNHRIQADKPSSLLQSLSIPAKAEKNLKKAVRFGRAAFFLANGP
jgi:hypothetical protein